MSVDTTAVMSADTRQLLVDVLGPDAGLRLARPITAAELDLVDDALARHGSVAAALGFTGPQHIADRLNALNVGSHQ
ncbi:MAG TPA: hypothetical protein VI172_14880 [Candidatus Dormibacteraeota bacterium]|jgi:hypothetical protein